MATPTELLPALFFVSCAPTLRSIYEDEFGNFVERMSDEASEKQKQMKKRVFVLSVDVVDPMLDVLLDTDLDADTSLER